MKAHVASLVVVVLAALSAANGTIYIDPEMDQENRCGGPIEADSGSLTFPDAGQETKAGELCIWTIHLQSLATFRLNFTTFDVRGDNTNCTGGAVRLYSLTNLIPASRAESYTFCNQEPPTDGNFFLSENLVTVIFRSDHNSSQAGAGFTLNWEGIAVQPIPKTHESTYTSATSGIIRHPIVGEYPANTVSTWLVRGSDLTPGLRIHFNSPYVALENCSIAPASDCLCDALILYEISVTGELQELRRLCGNVNGTEVANFGPNFILAFFADHIDDADSGRGFEVLYFPESVPTPPPTSPRPPGANYTQACGGVLTGTEGAIDYKAGTYYANYERCVWVVRSELRSQITFKFDWLTLETNYDFLIITTFDANGTVEREQFSGVQTGLERTFNGSVAVVVFMSDSSNVYQGPSISFVADGPLDDNVHYFEDIKVPTTQNEGVIKYPEEGAYANRELSTFVFSPPSIAEGNSNQYKTRLNFTAIDLEVGSDGICRDYINIYYMSDYSSRLFTKYSAAPGICNLVNVTSLPVADTYLVVLATDSFITQDGFEVEWDFNSRQ